MKCVSSAMAGGVILTVFLLFLSATAAAAEGDQSQVATAEVAAVPSAVSHSVEPGNRTRVANHLLRTVGISEKCGWGTASGKICSDHARHGSSHFGRAKLLPVATTAPAASTFRLPSGSTATPVIGVASAADLLLDTDKADAVGVNRTVPVMDITQGTTASAHTVQAVENGAEHPGSGGTSNSEPPAYAVLLASLGIVAFIVSRRLN